MRRVTTEFLDTFRRKKVLERCIAPRASGIHNRAGNGRFDQHVLPGTQGSESDDQLGQVSQRGIKQAARYDLPMAGPTIDLPKFVRAVHDFLARNAQKLAQEDDPLLRSATTSPALEWYREERAKIAQLERLARERVFLPRACLDRGSTELPPSNESMT